MYETVNLIAPRLGSFGKNIKDRIDKAYGYRNG